MSYNEKQAPRVVNIWAGSNPWGYMFNINHPTIRRLYKEYQLAHGLDTTLPMTDAQRHAFEGEIMEKIRKKEII